MEGKHFFSMSSIKALSAFYSFRRHLFLLQAFSRASVVKQVLSPAFNATTDRGPRGRIENKSHILKLIFSRILLFLDLRLFL